MGNPLVLVDGRMARRRRTGAATYVNDLRDALRDLPDPGVDVRFVWGPPPVPRRNRLTSLANLVLDVAWTQLLLPLLALRHRAALIHVPFNWGPRWAPCPVVVTVQDLAWERVPDAFPGAFRRYARLFARQSARRAARVITTSRSTADDLVDLYKVPRARIRTIPIGVTMDVQPASPARERFILAVGEFEPRKRILELIAAHAEYVRSVPEDPPPYRLVLAGAGGSQQAAARAAARDGSVELLGFVSDDVLRGLYRRAALLVYPSAYEGFGLPVLEAMAHGCPALIARNSSLPEVGGDAAMYIDDPSITGIARALTIALTDPAELARRGDAARRHAESFAWEPIAEQTIAVYREAAR